MARFDVEIREKSGCMGSLGKIGIALLVIIVVLAAIVQTCKEKDRSKPIPTASMPPTIAVEVAPGETAAPAQPQKIFLGEHVAAYKKSQTQEYNPQLGRHFTMGGNPYYRGFTMTSYSPGGFAYYNLSNYGFKKMKGLVGCLDEMYSEALATLSFYGDDVLLKQIKLKPDKLPTSFEIDITGISQLRINVASSGNGFAAEIGCADVIFE